MQTLTQPSLLLKPFAEQGDKNTLPVVNTEQSEPQRADLTNGFPAIVSLRPDQGGLPPERKDFNALGYLTTTYDWFYQCGGTFTFDPTISTAIGGYPLGARLWYTDSDGITKVLRSAIPNNTNNFLEDESVIGNVGENKPWVIENFIGVAKSMPLFSFNWFDYDVNDESWICADTFSWQDGTVYSNAYNHLVDDIDGKTATTETIGSYTISYYLADDGHKITTDESTVSNIYSLTGVAWYYILDTANQRFKLPRTKWGFTGYRGIVGNYIPPSLPNIKGYGTGHQMGNAGGGTSSGGAIYTTSSGYQGTSDHSGNAVQINFDASRSSTIYQDGAQVQPRATQMHLYFYIGNFSLSATEQTAGLNAALFNGKLDLDMGNATTLTKETIVGWGAPDYSAGITKSWDTNTTAEANGCVIAHASAANSTRLNVVVNNVTLPFNDIANGGRLSVSFSVAKGDTWKVYGGDNSERNIVFYPCIGG